MVYDNPAGEALTAELVRTGSGTVFDAQETRTEGDFGRAIFTFERGEMAWPGGNYAVIITDGKAEEVVEFIINNFDTGSSPLVGADGQVALPGDDRPASGSWEVADIAQPEDGFCDWSGARPGPGRQHQRQCCLVRGRFHLDAS